MLHKLPCKDSTETIGGLDRSLVLGWAIVAFESRYKKIKCFAESSKRRK